MNQYRVIVTEMHNAEYHVDARTESEAHTLVINGLAGEPVDSWYNAVMDDEDDAYIVEITDDENEKDKIQATSNGVKEYLERQEFFEDTE